MNTAPQHSYDQFTRYESDIAAIINNYPNVSILDPRPMSPVTYQCRIRDAINAFYKYDYPSSLFTRDDVARVFRCVRAGGEYIFTFTGSGFVSCGPVEKTTPAGLIDIRSRLTIARDDELDANDNELFDAILVLKNRNIYLEPIQVVNLSSEQLARITNSYPNIEVDKLDEFHYLLT